MIATVARCGPLAAAPAPADVQSRQHPPQRQRPRGAAPRRRLAESTALHLFARRPRAGRGVATWQIAFSELAATPTMITVDGHDAPSSGFVWVTPSGIILRTELKLSDPQSRVDFGMTVNYARDKKLRKTTRRNVRRIMNPSV